MTLTAPELSNARDALALGAAVRTRVRSLPVGDPDRDEALNGALGSLRDCWTADHERYCRRGRKIGRTLSTDAVHVLSHERRAEMKRLRSMLRPTTGTPRTSAAAKSKPTQRTLVEDYSYTQMFGSIGRMRQAGYEIASEHDAARRVLGGGQSVARRGGGGNYRSMTALNTEARRLFDDLAEWRRWVNSLHRRYARGEPSSYQEQDQRDQIAGMLAVARNEATILARDLRASAERRTPIPAKERPREKWPEDRCREALREHHNEHGRWPTADQLRTVPTLPHYTTLQRLWGPRFIERLDDLVPSPSTARPPTSWSEPDALLARRA